MMFESTGTTWTRDALLSPDDVNFDLPLGESHDASKPIVAQIRSNSPTEKSPERSPKNSRVVSSDDEFIRQIRGEGTMALSKEALYDEIWSDRSGMNESEMDAEIDALSSKFIESRGLASCHKEKTADEAPQHAKSSDTSESVSSAPASLPEPPKKKSSPEVSPKDTQKELKPTETRWTPCRQKDSNIATANINLAEKYQAEMRKFVEEKRTSIERRTRDYEKINDEFERAQAEKREEKKKAKEKKAKEKMLATASKEKLEPKHSFDGVFAPVEGNAHASSFGAPRKEDTVPRKRPAKSLGVEEKPKEPETKRVRVQWGVPSKLKKEESLLEVSVRGVPYFECSMPLEQVIAMFKMWNEQEQ